jgi:hypothetical protein
MYTALNSKIHQGAKNTLLLFKKSLPDDRMKEHPQSWPIPSVAQKGYIPTGRKPGEIPLLDKIATMLTGRAPEVIASPQTNSLEMERRSNESNDVPIPRENIDSKLSQYNVPLYGED